MFSQVKIAHRIAVDNMKHPPDRVIARMSLALQDSLRLAAAAHADAKICNAAWHAAQLAAAVDFLQRGPDLDGD